MPASRSTRPRAAKPGADTSERIAIEIRRYLAQKSLQPGDRLGTEQELAAEFGVSRPTLREALRLLASSHLVRSSRGPGGGVFVATTPSEAVGLTISQSVANLIDTRDLTVRELLDARLLLEVPLAGIAAANATTQTVLKLEASIADSEGNPATSEVFQRAYACFHRTIAQTADNALLRVFTDWTLDVLHPMLENLIGDALDGELILDQHRAILAAVRRARAAAAERAMREHLEYVSTRLRALEECPDARDH